MFTKSDRYFIETALNPTRRRLAIMDIRKRRDVMFWLACMLSICAIAAMFTNMTAGIAGLGAVAQWIFAFKFDSDLRLLNGVDQLQIDLDRGSRDNPGR